MKIRDIIDKKFSLSFEIFPPKRNGNIEDLFYTISELKKLYPDFVSVTYGAGGSNKENSLKVASLVKNKFELEVLAHLTCVNSNKEDISEIIESFQKENIENILALRGDSPKGTEKFEMTENGFAYANELISFIREKNGFCFGAACYPQGHIESLSLESDIINLRRKIKVGANFLITQFFFDNRDFYNFLEKVGNDIPIIPGIIPILNYKSIKRMTELNGHELPKKLNDKIEKLADKPEEIEKYGIEYATEQAQDLINHKVRGLHFYCMNRSEPIKKILEGLNLKR
jgi:methylenetetrahydrofolate reductase (NADPH)